MSNLWRRLIGLGALAGAAAVAVVGLAHDGRRQARAAAAAAAANRLLPTLAGVDVEAVTEVRLEGPGPTLRAVRGPGGWRLLAPIATAAEATAVDALVTAALRLTGQRRVDADADAGGAGADGTPARADAASGADAAAAIFGLAPPRWRLCLAAGGRSGQLEVGRSSGFDGTVYVRSAGAGADAGAGSGAGAIWQVDGSFAALVDKDLYRLRDKRPLHLDPAGITELTVTSPRVSYRLARGAGERLDLVAPLVAPADQAHVEMVLAALTGTRAQAFVREAAATAAELAPFGLDRPALEVTLTGAVAAPGEPLPIAPAANRVALRFGEVAVGGRAPQVFVARVGGAPAPVLALDQDWTLSRLRAPLAALRDLHITHARAGEVARIDIDAPHASLQLTRGEAGAPAWTAVPAAPLDPAAVAGMLQQLVGLRGDQVLVEHADAAALATYGLAAPRLRVALRGRDGACLGSVHLGRAAAGQVAIRAGGSSRIDRVSGAAVSRLTADVGALVGGAAAPAHAEDPASGATAAAAPRSPR